MSRPVKYIAIALAVVLVCAAVFGVALLTARQQTDVKTPGLYVNEQQVANPAAPLTIGGKEVPFNVYRHYFLLYKSFYALYYGYDDSFFAYDPDGDNVAALKGAVESELLAAYAWVEIAAERGIELSQEDLDEINATLAEQKTTHGEDFEDYLHNDMLFDSEETYLEVTKMQELAQKVQEVLLEELKAEYAQTGASLPAEDMGGYVTAKHILIQAEGEAQADGTTVVSAEAKEAAKEEADGLYAQLMDTENEDMDVLAKFDELMLEFGEDPGVETNPDGYTFGAGEMVDIFYDTAISLDIDEISQPVWNETHGGWHIILRLPLAETGIESALTAKRNEILAEKMDTLETTFADYYDDFKALDIV